MREWGQGLEGCRAYSSAAQMWVSTCMVLTLKNSSNLWLRVTAVKVRLAHTLDHYYLLCIRVQFMLLTRCAAHRHWILLLQVGAQATDLSLAVVWLHQHPAR